LQTRDDTTDEEGFLACARNDGFEPGADSGNDGLGVGESAAMEKAFHVYILAGKSGVLYTGVTGHLAKRIWQHKEKLVDGFARRYNLDRLVWFERHATARAAIAREKEIKGWRRSKKTALIEVMNPGWRDLSDRL